ncbi:hypothetical protein ACS0TY_033230 [Phlomoides rotata]
MDRLGTQNKRRFQDSCFRQFLGLGNIQFHFQGMLYLHLLFMQGNEKMSNKLIFHVNGEKTEFSPHEFSLIIGLHFGHKSPIPPFSKIYTNNFKKNRLLKLIDIENAFMKAKDGGEGDLSLKLALLWVLHGILLVKGHTSKKIETQYIHLVDDLDEFNKFPWGHVAFEFLIKEFRAAV